MENNKKQQFLHSLELPDAAIENDIPLILENLWELGSIPGYIIALMKKHIPAGELNSVTDFGCGKGAVLIQAARELNFRGLGIDIVPTFIDAANKFARRYKVADRLKFETGDITTMVRQIRKQDVVIYGYDSGILGNVTTSLELLQYCVKPGGWIILEVAYYHDDSEGIEDLPSETELTNQIKATGLKVIERVIWDVDRLKKINAENNKLIAGKINELTAAFPGKAALYKQYMDNQLKESMMMEQEMVCSTWLLQKKL